MKPSDGPRRQQVVVVRPAAHALRRHVERDRLPRRRGPRHRRPPSHRQHRQDRRLGLTCNASIGYSERTMMSARPPPGHPHPPQRRSVGATPTGSGGNACVSRKYRSTSRPFRYGMCPRGGCASITGRSLAIVSSTGSRRAKPRSAISHVFFADDERVHEDLRREQRAARQSQHGRATSHARHQEEQDRDRRRGSSGSRADRRHRST